MFKDLKYIVDLEEAFSLTGVDEANGVIKAVVLLTGNKVSHNKTKYLGSSLDEAVKRYEGAKFYADHQTATERKERHGVRSVRDLAGTYRNVRRDGDKVLADLHVMEHQRSWGIPIAKARPRGVGLSISDRGRVREEGGVTLVEGFEAAAPCSIDMVTEVSLNTDLFESKQDQGGIKMEFEKLQLKDLVEQRPDLAQTLRDEGVAKLQKDLDEAKKAGKDMEAALLESRKNTLLVGSKLPAEAMAALKLIVSKPSVTLEEAVSLIEASVKAFEALGKIDGKEPKVKVKDGNRDMEEGKKDIPSDEDFVTAFRG